MAQRNKSKCTNQQRYSFKELEEIYNNPNNETFDYIKTYEDILKNKLENKIKYIVSMYFYPSGSAHLGHGRVASIVDVYVRFLKKTGYKVYCPMGFDSFGLPAEEAAKRNNINPAEWTDKNIEILTSDLKKLNVLYNWESGLRSHDIKYYGEQQKIIQILWKNGLLEQKESWVNWDPELQTVLANEQVDKNGICWRSGAQVQRKKITQWFIKTTKYAQKLLEELPNLNWPSKVKNAQKKWIGKSSGIYYEFISVNFKHVLKVFTSAPECLYGVSFLVISPESSYATQYYQKQLNHYNATGEIIPIDYVAHDELSQRIPVFFADYVVADYGTGAVMGVPSINKQDRKFAKENNLSIIAILDSNNKLINSQGINGLSTAEARKQIMKQNKVITLYRIKDWCISRQRYWGAPLPFIHCKKCGIVLAELPVELPKITNFKDKEGKYLSGNPLEHCDWVNVDCPICGNPSKRETDTMDTFVDSSWYYLRYLVHNNKYSKNYILYPSYLDLYVGGIEHTNMHLIYTRVIIYMLIDVGLLKLPKNAVHKGNLIKKLVCQGMVLGPSYQGKETKKYYNPFHLEKKDGKYYGNMDNLNNQEEIIVGPVEKISKSLNNGIPISHLIDKHGSDAFKLFIISDTPPESDMIIKEGKLNSVYLFLQKVWQLHWLHRDDRHWESHENSWVDNMKFNNKDDTRTIDNMDYIFQTITKNLENLKLNVYVGSLRKLFNMLSEMGQLITKSTHRLYFVRWLNCFECVCPCLSQGCLDLLNEDYKKNHWYAGNLNKTKSKRKLIIQVDNYTTNVVNLDKNEKDIIAAATQVLQDNNDKRAFQPHYKTPIVVHRGNSVIINFLTNSDKKL